jgi:hypothetical protein
LVKGIVEVLASILEGDNLRDVRFSNRPVCFARHLAQGVPMIISKSRLTGSHDGNAYADNRATQLYQER